MFLGRKKNEYGTPIIECSCDFCGTIFTVCCGKEHTDEEAEAWGKSGCQHKDCKSYNPATDIDLVLATEEEIQKEKVVNMEVLKNRKNMKFFIEEIK